MKMPSDATKGAGASSLLNTLALSFLVITLWLVTRPYQGIVDDSRFYTVQALNEMLHGRFADDLYFQFGSQDQFSIFSRVYGPLLGAFGIARANLILTSLAEALWLSGLFYLSAKMFPDRTAMFIAVTLAIMLPGGSFFIRNGEPFLTPRLPAEAITMFAMGALVDGRPIRSALLLAVSALIHPLMTLPGLGVLFIYEAMRRPVWWAGVGAVLLLVLGLAWSSVQPFSRLFITFDPAWFAVAEHRNSFCFMTKWSIEEWLPVSTTLVLSGLVLTLAKGAERRLLLTCFFVTATGLFISLIGGDIFRNVLIADAQIWRSTSLLAIIAHLSLAPIILRVRNRGVWVFTSAILLLWLPIGLIAATNFSAALYLQAIPAALLAWLVIAWEERFQLVIPRLARVFVFLAVAVILGWTLIFVWLFLEHVRDLSRDFLTFGMKLLTICLALAAIVCTLAPHDGLGARFRPTFAVGLSGILLIFAASSWNKTSPWTKFVESSTTPPASLTALLPPGPVYWEGDVDVPWFVLRRDSYFSCDQGTGALFNRGTAMTYESRANEFRILNTLDFHNARFCPSGGTDRAQPVTTDALSSVCRHETGLAAIVLLEDVAGAPRHLWISPAVYQYNDNATDPPKRFRSDHFYIYDCADFR